MNMRQSRYDPFIMYIRILELTLQFYQDFFGIELCCNNVLFEVGATVTIPSLFL